MARNKKVNAPIEDTSFEGLTEGYISSLTNVKGVQLYNFVNAIKNSGASDFYYGNTYRRMTDDAIISSAIDLYVEDATQVDPNTHKMCWVELDKPDGFEEDIASRGLVTELNAFLSEIDIEKQLPMIARAIVTYGDCPIRLGFVDKAEDELLTIAGRKLESDSITINDNQDVLNEDFEFNDETLDKYLGTNVPHSAQKLYEHNQRRILSKYVKLNEGIGNDGLQTYVQTFPGRWYIEELGSGIELYGLYAKGKLIGFLNKNNLNKFISRDNIVMFSNNKVNKVTVSVGSINATADELDYYTVQKGESYLKNARVAWQVLSALEDIFLLARMTRSILYRIFSVEVGQKGNKETMDVLTALKAKMKIDESINVREKIYNSTISQVPLGDSIFIPTRNGIGAIDVKTVGGDMNIREAVDFDYFKDKLFAGLKVPRSFLGFEDEVPSGLGNSSLVRMDIRYARGVRNLQNALAAGVRDIIDVYLRYTRTQQVYEKLPDFRVVFTSINTAEDSERVESEKVKMETVDKIVETLNNLGINMDEYTEVRNTLIQKWFGSEIYDKVVNHTPSAPKVPKGPTEDEGINFKSTPANVTDTSGSQSDFEPRGPEDNLLGGEEEVPQDTGSEETEPKEVPQDIPYSLK